MFTRDGKGWRDFGYCQSLPTWCQPGEMIHEGAACCAKLYGLLILREKWGPFDTRIPSPTQFTTYRAQHHHADTLLQASALEHRAWVYLIRLVLLLDALQDPPQLRCINACRNFPCCHLLHLGLLGLGGLFCCVLVLASRSPRGLLCGPGRGRWRGFNLSEKFIMSCRTSALAEGAYCMSWLPCQLKLLLVQFPLVGWVFGDCYNDFPMLRS